MDSITSDQEAWFFYESANGSYYTSTTPSKKEYHVAGDGNTFPTPNELKAKLDQLGEDASVDESGLIYLWNEVDVKRKPTVLPPGCYQHMPSSPGGATPERLVPFVMRDDHYIKMESIYNPLAEDVKAFLENEAIYRKTGTIYKRGLLLYGPPGEGKCLGKGTQLLDYNGNTVLVENVKVGDLLMGDDSTPRTVLSLARGKENMYKVSFIHGGSFVCNESHILSLKWSGGGRKPKGLVKEISIREYLKLNKDDKHHLKSYMVGANFNPDEDLPLPAYLLGHWLGDGTSSKPQFTTMDLPVVREYQKYANLNGLLLKLDCLSGRAGTYSLSTPNHRQLPNRAKDCNSFTVALRQLNVFNNKHVPNQVLRQSKMVRMEFLAGLIDSDGSVNRTAYDYCSVVEELANGAASVARSLGFRATVKSRITRDQNKTECLSYRVRISGQGLHEIPVRLTAKQLPIRRQKKDQSVYGFTVTELGVDDYYGFELDGNKRFLLGDFTVTHNTSIIRVLVKNEIPKDSVVVFFEFMPTTDAVNAMKKSLSERLKVFVFEELANLLEHSKMERVLDFLDGEKSIDRTLMIATTNYPERLPGNIIERPSRFDKMYKMGHPKAKERKLILGHYLMREALDEEVKATDGLSTAALKEISLLTHLRKLTVMEAAKLMKDHSALVKKDFSETKSLGFGNRHDDDDF